MTQGRKRLPEAVRQFVERQTTLPATEVCAADPGEQRSPYGSYWYRAVACHITGTVTVVDGGTLLGPDLFSLLAPISAKREQEALQRRKVMRRARSTKHRSSLLAELERRYLSAP
jgi:hypothetical protein